MMQVEEALQTACKTLPVYWPLPCFIAVNPLWDLHPLSFKQALQQMQPYAAVQGVMPATYYQTLYQQGKISPQDWQEASSANQSIASADTTNVLLCSEQLSIRWQADVTALIREQIFNFLMVYFDRTQTLIPFNQTEGLYLNWCRFIVAPNKPLQKIIISLPTDYAAAVLFLLEQMQVQPHQYANYFAKIFHQVLGWSSLIKWLQQRPHNPYIQRQAQLIELLLIWLCYEKYYRETKPLLTSQLSADFCAAPRAPSDEQYIGLRAAELAYQKHLLKKLSQNHPRTTMVAPNVQAIFCIDTRSEGVRRHLEQLPGYQTYGFAGFFGFVFTYENPDCFTATWQCPALFMPENTLSAKPNTALPYTEANAVLNMLQNTQKSWLAPLALVEMTGFWYALAMLLKSFVPQRFQKLKRWFGQDHIGQLLQLNLENNQIEQAFPLEQVIDNAAAFLRTIGLIKAFAPVILICGHGAETDNNPFQASVDCGACGGNAGYVNAVVVCQLLNSAKVRQGLQARGIDIPSDSYFIAGLHNTTRNEILLHTGQLPVAQQNKVQTLQQDLRRATQHLKAELQQQLPGPFTLSNRSVQWAELIPEAGLVRNAALIIGPRHYTAKVDLERRVFLHSYDYHYDNEGELLQAILSGPLIVAHWINAQYYFSTTDPQVYGSGNKMLHNVLNGIGVIEGNLSDLKIGLPWQGIAFQDHLLHEPLRLLVLIYAPKALVEKVLAQNPTAQALFNGQWAHLKIMEPSD